ncbi:phytanoyl-CoA dioxygenase family protein [Streptomyces sp. bgisy027]|uniref:phytanoyl-CoA dioxygenase family protein n=1 Tax=Streptomyces sp. bgisy027 TaxID=3413770 RepID=UPI003D70C716
MSPQRRCRVRLALTEATVEDGCQHIATGSHELGYLSHELEAGHGQRRGRADQAAPAEAGFGPGDAVPVPVAAGDAVLPGVALLHRSNPNAGDVARVSLNARYLAPGAIRTRDGSAPGTPHRHGHEQRLSGRQGHGPESVRRQDPRRGLAEHACGQGIAATFRKRTWQVHQ